MFVLIELIHSHKLNKNTSLAHLTNIVIVIITNIVIVIITINFYSNSKYMDFKSKQYSPDLLTPIEESLLKI